MASTNPVHQCAAPDLDALTPDELLGCQILSEFPLLVQQFEFSLGLPPAWPVRAKRSAVVSPPDSVSIVPPPRPPPPPPPPSSGKDKESSPTTPFSLDSLPLSRCESDEINKANLPNKKPCLDKKSQYLETVHQLTQQNQALVGKVKLIKRHYNELKTTNSEWEAKRQKMIQDSKKESTNPEIRASSSAIKAVKFTVKPRIPEEKHHFHQCQPPIKNQTAVPAAVSTTEQSNSQNVRIPNGAISIYDPSFGPTGIPDLNLSFDEISQRNYTRCMAAQARQNRIKIWKSKNNNNNNNNGAARLLA